MTFNLRLVDNSAVKLRVLLETAVVPIVVMLERAIPQIDRVVEGLCRVLSAASVRPA